MPYRQMQHNGYFLPNGEMINNAPKQLAPNSWLQNAKPRLRWTDDLHDVFVTAVSMLGGPDEAKPTAINQTMERLGVHGLTLRQIKSHLQKYRNSCRIGKEEPRLPANEGPSFGVPPPAAPMPISGYNGEQQTDQSVQLTYYDLGMGLLQDENEMQGQQPMRTEPQGNYMDTFMDKEIDRALWEFLNY